MKILNLIVISNNRFLLSEFLNILNISGHKALAVYSTDKECKKFCQSKKIKFLEKLNFKEFSHIQDFKFIILNILDLKNNYLLLKQYKKETFILNPYFNKSKEDISLYIWSYLNFTQETFVPIEISIDNDTSFNEAFKEVSYQLLNQLSRDRIIYKENQQFLCKKFTLNIKKSTISEITSKCILFCYKFFNLDSLFLYNPIKGFLSDISNSTPHPILTKEIMLKKVDNTKSISIDDIISNIEKNHPKSKEYLQDLNNSLLFPIFNENFDIIKKDRLLKLSMFLVCKKNKIIFYYQNNIANNYYLPELLNSLDYFLNTTKYKTQITDLHPLYSVDENSHVMNFSTAKLNFNTLHEAFINIANKSPNHIALYYNKEKLTYNTLDEYSSIYARFINTNINHKTIAIYSFPTVDFIIAILGCLKAGKTLLLLDPKLPKKRIYDIINFSNTKTIFIQDTLVSDFKPNSNINIHEIKNYNYLKNLTNNYNNKKRFTDNKIAYLIYTSGSTGKPKGVLCTHIGALNMINTTINQYPVNSTDKLLYLASSSFDIVIWEIFCPLLSGASLVISKNPNIYSDVNYIKKEILKHSISILHMVPSVLSFFLKNAQIKDCTSLKTIVSGGETLKISTVRDFFDKLPNCQLYHGYGPTETAITCIHHKVEKKELYTDNIPLGNSLPNIKTIVVNEVNQILPQGVKGELLIGGIGVAQGYLNDKKQTKEKFINFILNDISYGTFYKSGDIVNRTLTNIYKFYGRKDFQIKINGLRIELPEIEENIIKITKSESVVTSINYNNKQIIVAYVVTKDRNKNFIKNLKRKLLQCLPGYMQPNVIYIINEIPKLASGKVNFKKLKECTINSGVNKHFIANNYIENEIYIFLSQLTNIDIISPKDSFLSLGLNSLVLTQLTTFINNKFKKQYPINKIAELDNINAIARSILKTSSDNYQNNEIIIPITRNQTLFLSHAQKRLWFVHMVEDQKSYNYNIINAFKVSSKLKKDILQKSLIYLTSFHESLRTKFDQTSGEPHQIIIDTPNINFTYKIIKEAIMEEFITKFCKYTFSLDKEVACKFGLFYIQDKDYYIFVILQHNIITDGWSTGILVRDISQIYNNLLNKKGPKIDLSPIQYADYAAWQNTQIKNNLYKKQLTYWKNILENYVELDFPLTYNRTSKQTFNGDTISLSFEISHILNFCKEKKVRLFTYLTTALNILLYNYTGQNDLLIGSAAANRGILSLKDIMGFFVNIFSIRTIFSTDDTIDELLYKTDKACIGAINNQDIPFDILVEKLKIEREPHKSPLFQILFLMQDASDNTILDLEQCDISEYKVTLDTSIYDITFNVYVKDLQLTIDCQFNTDLFSKSFIQRFCNNFHKVIKDLAKCNSSSIIKNYSLLSDNDLKLIGDFNKTPKIPINTTVIQQILNNFELTPDKKILYLDNDNSVSYREIIKNAVSISDCLNKQPSSPVAIILPKGYFLIFSMVACMISNRAYIPIDYNAPTEKINNIIKQADVKTILTTRNITNVDEGASILNPINIIKNNAIDTVNITNILKQIKVTDLAYIIFTSGSTGEPKGVKVNNANLMNVLLHFTKELNFSKESNLLSVTNHSFDIFQLEWLLPLINSGKLLLSDSSLDSIEKLCSKHYVSHIQATPSMWYLMLENNITFQSDIISIVGGEALTLSLLKKLQKHNKIKRILNVYGPTETTIWSTFADLTNANNVSIGRPIQNTECYVVNSDLNLVPIGCKGELIISGDGVSQGYCNIKETKKSFIKLNINKTDKNFYKTGDIVVLSENNELLFYNRIDNQVKIRGHRIELSEIAFVLQNHPDIKWAYCITIAKSHYEKYLDIIVGFVIKDNKSHTTIDELLNYCRQYLTNYMVPNYIITLNSIPMTKNGKINTKILQQHYFKEIRKKSSNPSKKKLSKTMKIISESWSKILNIGKITDVNTSFYALGGHSLLIPIVVADLTEKLKLPITIRDFVQYPTISSLANYIDGKKNILLTN